MEISNSEEKFTPTVDWIADKYFELNEWLFNGKLGNCLFEVYTSGKGGETSLGHFRFTGKGVKYRRNTRQMYWTDPIYLDTLDVEIDSSNFFEYTKPMIGLNGNYKRTEHMWLNTLVHEMCHYYTYMNGYVPVQAHGAEFRRIGSIVGTRSNGIFEIKRLCNAENIGELDGEIAAKRQARDDKKKSNMIAVLVFRTNGDIQLITTTSHELVRKIVADNNRLICKKILETSDKEYIDYLWAQGYKHNMRTYRYWPVQGKELVDEIKNYDYGVLKGDEMNESCKLTNEDIKTMVKEALNKIMGRDNELMDITPDMILSDESPL